MKKLMIGLMGLVMMGAMALPAAAQSRNWHRDSQLTFRGDNYRRDDFDVSRRDNDRDDRELSWNRYDVHNRDRRWEREHHRGVNFRVRIF